MTSGFLRHSLFRGLAFRVILFLSLALLPIGLIAVIQTRQIAMQSEQTAQLSLMAVTEQAAATERTNLQEAVGAGRALASVVRLVRDDPRRCTEFFKNYKAEHGIYRLVGFVQNDGIMNCSSTRETYNLSASAIVQQAIETRARTVKGVAQGAVSDNAVVVITTPVFDAGEAIGFVFISINRAALVAPELPEGAVAPLSLVTFNAEGEVITSEHDDTVTNAELPHDYTLAQLTRGERQVFRAPNVLGVERVYAVLPMLDGSVFALSVWPVDTPLLQTDFSGRLTTLLPIFMWVASLIVAFWALNRLAITHIRKLGRQMRHFALNRALPRKILGEGVPLEITNMEQSFLGMANSILQDEARLEDSLREKNILLKEVHHRVKNNLQLISSIMSMQIRQAPTEENRHVLQRLQDRILSLATVHQSLYLDDDMSRVDMGMLLREIVARNLAVGLAPNSGIEIHQEYDSLFIASDDAAPLTLLVSEAVTNALKYVPEHAPEGTEINVSLKQTGPEMALLRITNTAGGATRDAGTGLGSKLIKAFARQLGGTLETREGDGLYTLELAFPVPLAAKSTYDY